ncbi:MULTISPECIES: hypothetical protein [Flavobacterium]|uniref:hypothetical protein n=1 Tax=Flavobacterium TaxID=237 RepID=UPI002809029E|nr:hypothetical protein [Flavobacterium lindanitolerans]MDQ7961057.1 hypothetical protein [Flavobacterium lindanitolerans]
MDQYLEIKKSIRESLLQRNLKNPSIRLNAIENIEKLLAKEINDMILNPMKLIEVINKDDLKRLLSKHKNNGRLSDAESSIINEYYNYTKQ